MSKTRRAGFSKKRRRGGRKTTKRRRGTRRRSRVSRRKKGGFCYKKCVPGITNCGKNKTCSIKPRLGVSCPLSIGPGWCV